MWENFDPLKKKTKYALSIFRQIEVWGNCSRLLFAAHHNIIRNILAGEDYHTETHAIQFAATPCSCSSLPKKEKSTLCLPYRLFFQWFSRPKSILLLTCSQQISQEVRGETIKGWCEARPNCYLLVRPPVPTAKGFKVAWGLGGYLE